MNRSSRTLVFCSLIGIGLFSLLNALPSSVGTEAIETINKLRAEVWLRNQIGDVVGEKSTPGGQLCGSRPSPNHESGQPKAESRASESPTAGLKAAESVAPQTENLQPKTAADPDLWNFGIGHSPLVPLSPLRPIFTEILLTSLAVEEEGAELVGMTVQMDLPELGLTGEAILTDIRSAPAIEPPVDHLDTRQVVTATFHHSSGDVIDLVLADEHPGEQLGLSENPPCQNGGKPRAESRVGDPVPANATNTANGHSPLNTCDFPNTEHLKPKALGEAETEPIGTTSNHPFWSVDRQEFVQAGSLEIGERLQTLSGDVKVVQQKLPRPGPQPVFNLEVHNEHVYFVGEDGVLVHNAGPDGLYTLGGSRLGVDDLALEYAIERGTGEVFSWTRLASRLNVDESALRRMDSTIRKTARGHGLITPAQVNSRGIANFSGHTHDIISNSNGMSIGRKVFVPEAISTPYASHEGILRSLYQTPNGYVWDHMARDGYFQPVERTIHAVTGHKGYSLWRTARPK